MSISDSDPLEPTKDWSFELSQPSTKPFKPTPIPAALTRIRFLWTHFSSCLYRKLSHNLARELCLYLGEPCDLLYFRYGELFRVNPISRSKSPFFPLDCTLGRGNMDAAVFLGREEVFMMLRDTTSAYEDYPYYMVFQRTLRNVYGCREDRFHCSLLYDPIRECVYIFGGHESFHKSNSQDSKVCEKFLPAAFALEPLPDMLEPRSCFGMCWCQDYVYICGGCILNVEKFDPQTLVFTQIANISEEVACCTTFSHEGCLYLLENSVIWKEEGRKWKKVARKLNEEESCWWDSPSFVSLVGNYCHFISGDSCVSLDLRTFAETSFPLD